MDLNAKAGSSYSSSSSGGFSKSSSSYGSKSYGSSATTQYSSTATRPSTSYSTPSSTSSSSSASTSYTKPSGSYATTNSSTTYVKPTSTPNGSVGSGGTTIINNGSGEAQGSSGLGTALAVGAGVVGGAVIADAITGHNQHGVVQQGAPQGVPQGVVQNGNGYVQQGSYVPQGTQGTSLVQVEQPTTFWSSLLWFFGLIFKLLILCVIAFGFYRVYLFIKRKQGAKLENREANLPTFKKMFIDIQYDVASENGNKHLSLVCTQEMYDYFMNIKSENGEKGFKNVIERVEVVDITTREFVEDEDDAELYHSVKIRFKMVDYVVNDKNEIVDGDKDSLIEDIEVWTFVSKDSGKSWKLSAIEQYVK
jgi:hypothetical protein